MSVQETAEKISSMEIRGAGKIARAAAEALKNFILQSEENDPVKLIDALSEASDTLLNTRPTAVSLANALAAVLAGAKGATVDEIRANVTKAAEQFILNSIQAIDRIAEICSSIIIENGNTIMTHCNSTVVVKSIIKAHNHRKQIRVYATETRPWRQGFITAQALADAGVDITLIVDSAACFFMAETDLVLIGADTITAAGTVYNKIGTSQIAICAHEKHVPVFVCAETYKILNSTMDDDSVKIEERDSTEVVEQDKLPGVKIRNPVFDATPPNYINGIVTEQGIISPSEVVKILTKKQPNNGAKN